MNTSAIEPVSAATARPAALAAPPRKPARPAAPPQPPAAGPAATTQMTQVPASVGASDRATYLQLLKACGGNVDAALAALHAMKAAQQST